MILSGGVSAHPSSRVKRIILEGRVVALCDDHAHAVLEEGIETLRELRERFLEADGRRSRIDRRSPLDRRAFPPRPEGRRKGQGRRTSDPLP
jgi:hypothetical protein